MQNLYIEQKVFSWRDKFKVTDEYGRVLYYVKGEIFTWGRKLHIYYPNGDEAAFIKQEVWSFLPRYYVFIDGKQIAETVKKFTFFYPKYIVKGMNWEVEGSFLSYDYEITAGGNPVAVIHKKWVTWGDCYELSITKQDNILPALAVVLTIDCVMADAANSNS